MAQRQSAADRMLQVALVVAAALLGACSEGSTGGDCNPIASNAVPGGLVVVSCQDGSVRIDSPSADGGFGTAGNTTDNSDNSDNSTNDSNNPDNSTTRR